MKVYVNPTVPDRLRGSRSPSPSLLTRVYARPSGQCRLPLAAIQWHYYPEMPVIPPGHATVDIIYRSAPDSPRLAVATVTPEMTESVGAWQHVAGIFTIDNWMYASDIL